MRSGSLQQLGVHKLGLEVHTRLLTGDTGQMENLSLRATGPLEVLWLGCSPSGLPGAGPHSPLPDACTGFTSD